MKLKRNKKIGLVFFLAFVIAIGLLSLFEKDFDASKWKANPLERYQMVDDIIETQILIGQTKNDVIAFLGKPDSIIKKSENAFIYNLGTAPRFISSKNSKLLIVFNNGNVVRVTEAED